VKKVHLRPVQLEALAYVRANSGCSTSDLAIVMGRHVKDVRETLDSLVEVKLIGRQAPFGAGEFESHWYPEQVTE
jgi:predicted transcriptional regulator